ncbi:MAG: DUF4330 domain-containing protein [Chroococcus sp. CMT-3BRIN-NPC107]|jgi:hypothetical protein|nr:DUF4330 domain-containing protein [Chroococcus sp. CMT-3BRIN-NPC107]
MAILDSQGRLFGKINLLDLGAVLVIVLVLIGIFLYPGTSGSVAQVNEATKPVEVDLVVRGLNIKDPEQLFTNGFTKGGKTNIVIRNQPHGSLEIQSVQQLPRTILVAQPDGSLKEYTDPRPNQFSTDMLLTLKGKATIRPDGAVISNSKLKIGNPIELEGFNYNFNATVIDVRIIDKK